MELLIATQNQGKIAELEELLSGLPLSLRSLKDFPDVGDVEETGTTFAENATLKAKAYAIRTGLLALADDSGLEVEALGGAPGIFSARYAGANSGYPEKIAALLAEIESKKDDRRAARFVCSMTISDEKGRIIHQTDGICPGRIAPAPLGNNGFGYDPVFIPAGFEETFGQLSGEIKRNISHRARATKKIIRFLRDFTAT
ncbi:MAG: RdgB/HAM1 family non-canonical purine NTP pyrophosphatase [Pyrinomonadaceae bacterium]